MAEAFTSIGYRVWAQLSVFLFCMYLAKEHTNPDNIVEVILVFLAYAGTLSATKAAEVISKIRKSTPSDPIAPIDEVPAQ